MAMGRESEAGAVAFRQTIGRAVILPLFGVFVVIASVMVVSSLTAEGGPAWVLVAFWLLALAWNAYWWLLRLAVELRFESDDLLVWSTPLRTRRIPLSAITKVRPVRVSSNLEALEHTQGRPVVFITGNGLQGFFDELAQRRPDLEIRLGWEARVSRRMSFGYEAWQRVE